MPQKQLLMKCCTGLQNWWALVNVVMNLWFPLKVGTFLISSVTVSFSRKAMLHGVSQLVSHSKTALREAPIYIKSRFIFWNTLTCHFCCTSSLVYWYPCLFLTSRKSRNCFVLTFGEVGIQFKIESVTLT
jgi:hypothetical protein